MSKRMSTADAAHIVGLRYGYNDPAAVELRARAKREALGELLGEIATVAMWLGAGYLWIVLMWPEV